MKQYPIRYGHIWSLLPAIILPPLLSIYPFIWLLLKFPQMNEWLQYFLILGFLLLIALFTIRLTLKVYPQALLTIHENEIGICFAGTGWLHPDDFYINITDITFMSPYNITGNDYILIKTKNPARSFRVSARSYDTDTIVEFNAAIEQIREKVSAHN